MKKRNCLLILVAVCVLACMVTLTACAFSWPSIDDNDDNFNVQKPAQTDKPNSISGSGTRYDVTISTTPTRPEGENTLADVIERIHSQVVEIYVTLSNGTSAGSGTFIGKATDTNEYFILTAMHVVDNANEIEVRTTDGTTYTAEFIGGVPDNDIAVIKITSEKEQNIATVRDITDVNAKLRIGEDAIAIGNPLGTLGGSVSKGIISAISRDMRVENYQMTLLQMDTSINGGNSGGALFDANGNLIGVVNAKIVKEEVEGIGFAIPIDTALDIALSVIKTAGNDEYNGLGYHEGKILLGITVQTGTRDGQFVMQVTAIDSYGSAYGSGLKSYDEIVEIDGVAVKDSNALKNALSEKQVGDTLSLTVKRYEITSSMWGDRINYQKYDTITVDVVLRQYVYGYVRPLD